MSMQQRCYSSKDRSSRRKRAGTNIGRAASIKLVVLTSDTESPCPVVCVILETHQSLMRWCKLSFDLPFAIEGREGVGAATAGPARRYLRKCGKTAWFAKLPNGNLMGLSTAKTESHELSSRCQLAIIEKGVRCTRLSKYKSECYFLRYCSAGLAGTSTNHEDTIERAGSGSVNGYHAKIGVLG